MQDEGSIKFIAPGSDDWEVSDLRERLEEETGGNVAILDVSRVKGGFKVAFDSDDQAEEEATQIVIAAIAVIFPESAVIN